MAVNTGPARSGTVTIGGESFTVNQASGCSWALDPTSVSVGTGGGSGGVNVTAGAGCGWTAVSNDGWITVTGGASGSGNGTVGYTVAANAGQARSGTIAIADQTFSIDQAGNAFTDIGASLTGVITGSIAWGDYDNDGDLDILLAGDGFGAVAKVYRNDGGGVFTDIGAGLTGVYQAAAAWGDYDNDGDLDILLAGSNSGGNPVTMVYRNDGGGSFTDIGAALVGINRGSAAWGDYDNDGDLDILLAGFSNSGLVSKVYRNDGGGVFTDIGAALVGVYDKGAVAWGDYDNDGDLDILLAGGSDFGARNAKVYRNDGGDVFTDIGAALTPVSSCSVAWGDYDNDGDLDILLTGTTGSTYVAKLYRNDGGGAFTDTGAALSGVYSGSVAWGDYDNDGDLDILLAGYSNSAVPVSIVYRNDGGGVFTDIGASLIGVFSGSVTTWGDYDNDGRLDILLAGSYGPDFVTKLYRGGGPTPNTAPDAPTDLVAVAGPGQLTLGWTASSDAQTPAAGLTYNVHVGTTAGGIQIASPMASLGSGYRRVAQPGNAGQRTTTVIKGLVPGTYHWGVQAVDTAFAGSPFASEVTVAVDQGEGCSWTLDPTAASVGSGAGTGAVGVATRADCFWAAVSNDAWITVTGTASGWGNGAVSYSVALNSGPARSGTITIEDQTFTVSQAESTFTDIGAAMTGVYGSVAWGDYDNDGDLDVVVAGMIGSGPISKVYQNDGAGAFTDIGAALTGVDGAVAWGDYDNDGDLDILLAGSDGANRVAKLYRNDGGGAFTEISAGLTGVSGAAVAWGDYDNDGDLDILLTGYVGSNVGISKVYRNDGGGTFTDIGAALTGVFAGSVAWGDYDSDGDLDILLAGWVPFSTRLAKVYRNDGGGVFTDIGAALTGVAYSSAAWGDYDNDGDLDILLAGATVSNYVSHVYRNDGSDVFTDAGAALTGVASGSVAWGDYDNDGDLDILLAGMGFSPPDSGVSRVYRNDGAGTFTDAGAAFSGSARGPRRGGTTTMTDAWTSCWRETQAAPCIPGSRRCGEVSHRRRTRFPAHRQTSPPLPRSTR